jgi:serine/threonine protein kinase
MSDAPTPDAPRSGTTAEVPGSPFILPRFSTGFADNSPTIISLQKPQDAEKRVELSNVRGRRLGAYELIEAIGVGGMAAVIRATDVDLGRIVAVKILPPELARDADHVSRFKAEARAAAKLDHENIARIYGCGEEQGLHYIAFEYVEGVTLRALIDRCGALPVAESVRIVLQIADGLAHAAARGVVHRDIKPSNIIVSPTGRAKIVDMGLARHLDGGMDGVTQSGVTLGSFDYISPEQALEPRAADERSDIYSLGCTLYHVLTGQPPVPDGTAAKKLQHHQSVAPADPRTLNPRVPDSVVAVIGRMMAKDPAERYQRTEQLVDDLRMLSRSLESTNDPSELPQPLWAESHSAPTPSRIPWMTAVAAVLGVTTIVAVLEMVQPASGPGFRIVPLEPPAPLAASGESPADGVNMVGSERVAAKPPDRAHQPETVYVAETANELRDLFSKSDAVLRIRLTALHYDLTSSNGIAPAGLIFRGKRLELEPEDPTRVVTFQFTPGQQERALLSLAERDGAATEVQIRGVRFQCDSADSNSPIVAIAGSRVRQLNLERCAFRLPDSADISRGSTALAVHDGDAEGSPAVRLSECLFVRGAHAIQLAGRGTLTAVNCAFGPHRALVHLRGTSRDTVVRFEHCSALMDNTAAVLLEDSAAARIAAGHCLFSRPQIETTDEPAGDAVLIRQIGAKTGHVTYRVLIASDGNEQRNAYHNLSAIWSDETSGGTIPATTLDQARLRPAFDDHDALELSQVPWLDAKPLSRLLAGDERAAFAVNPKLAALRLPRAPQSGTLGVQRNVWGPTYVRLEPLGNPAGVADGPIH